MIDGFQYVFKEFVATPTAGETPSGYGRGTYDSLQVQTELQGSLLGPVGGLFTPFLGEGSPTKIDYRKIKGTHILTPLLEDLVYISPFRWFKIQCITFFGPLAR